MRTTRLSRPALAVGVAAAGAVATAGPAGYVLFFRRWCLTWGARDDEVAAKLPGDELLPDAGLVTVHGTRQPGHGAQDAARHQTARRAYRRRPR
jgi:hypothetical protein